MSQINWSKSPEWANKHGFVGADVRAVWLNDEQYCYAGLVNHSRTYNFAGKEGWGRGDITNITARPESEPAWNGKGLPPVGTVCENVFPGEMWREVIVIAHDDDMAVFRLNNSDRLNYFGDTHQHFRPIRTAEQIAAEEREAAITAMVVLMGRDPNSEYIRMRAGILYDAGYRKQAPQ